MANGLLNPQPRHGLLSPQATMDMGEALLSGRFAQPQGQGVLGGVRAAGAGMENAMRAVLGLPQAVQWEDDPTARQMVEGLRSADPDVIGDMIGPGALVGMARGVGRGVVNSQSMGKAKDSFDFSPGLKRAQVSDASLEYSVGRDGTVEVLTVKVPKESRGKGAARRAMEQLVEDADRAGLKLALTADPMEPGVSKTGLVKFYRSLGFKRNAGRDRDFSTRAEFIREPRGQ